MKDQNKTKEQLIGELAELRQRVAELEASNAACKRAEKTLRGTHEQLAATLDALPDLLFEVDRDGCIYDYRVPSPEQLYVPSEQFLGKTVREVLPEAAADIISAAIAETVEHGRHRGGTYSLNMPTGPSWFELSIAAKGDPHAPDARLIVLARNITERKRAMEALRKSEERYRLIAENVTDVIWVADMNFHFTYVSPSIERLRGYSAEEVMAQSLSDVLTPTSLMRAAKILEEERKNIERGTAQPRTVEFEFKCKDGSTVQTESTISVLYDENKVPVGVLGSTRDITERKRIEETLRESEEKYRELINGMNDTAWVIDFEGRFIDVNNAAVEALGYSREELLAMGPHDIDNTLDAEEIRALIKNMPADKIQVFETTHTTKDGKTIPVEIKSSLVTYQGKRAILSIARDITKRKQAEEALRESEARLRNLSDNLPGGMTYQLDMGVDGQMRQLTYVSAGVEKMHEVTAEAVLQDAQLLYGQIIEADRPLVAAQEAQAQAAMTTFSAEARFRLPSGATRWSLLTSAPRQAPNGHLIWDGIEIDITERKQAEEALKSAELEKEIILDSQLEHVVYQDKEHKILWLNQAACESVGMMREVLIGRHCYAIWDQRSERCEDCPVALAMETGRQQEVEKETPDGRIWFIRGYPVRNVSGEIVGGIEITQEITERKRAEEEQERLLVQIQEQARRMQQIVDTVPEGVLLLDADGRVILTNPVAERHLDVLAGARMGGTLTHLGNRPLAEFLTSPPKGLWHEITMDDKVFELIARPMENGHEPEDWVLVIRDMTHQREVEQRAQQQERLAAVGQLAAGIAHDFNNIMAAIVLYAQMTARMEELPVIVRNRMGTINQQAQLASNLIQQILDFSRRAVLDRRPLDLVPLLKEHVKLLKRTLPESIEVKLTYGPGEYMVHADPTRMQQMVTNLAVNARDAMPGGGTLHIELKQIKIKPGELSPLPEMEPGEWVQVTASDTGIGIPPDVLPHIFEPFFTTKAPGAGSGLGLAQVHGIVGQHGGRIDVESQVGKGTTFTIYLPALPASPPKPFGVPALGELSSLPTGKGETILVVEDNAVVRKALVDSLELLNYQVWEAMNGQEALTMLEQHSDDIDLLLSDVVMPGMGGMALLHALKEQGLTVRVVMMTGHSLEKELDKLRAHGMIDWLPKPPELEELAEVVARALGMD
jgi:two-component system cell cycle sensor histidine kinase/response regulator CckA